MGGFGLDLGDTAAGPFQGIAAAADFVLELTEQQGQLPLPTLLGGDVSAKLFFFAYPMTARSPSNCPAS